ncbi:MAG: inositol monophosphatase [Acidobacteria bacterium RIFCSPLOWO2_12_FULL_54_10]|nr:MAG: inositol monophosphatase [Acidobacteria bacterium RIFCSPLOWO2_12_FULL_54_10]
MKEFLGAAIHIARQAGTVLLPFFERRVAVEYKGDVDLVTEADRASEKLIVDRLKTWFPDHAILAEESGSHRGNSAYRWYVDPLDGTTNFAHGFPVFAVSIALEKNGEIILGVVYDPTRDELFEAEKGGGARLNGKPLRVSNISRLEEALVATGFPSKKRHRNPNIHFYHQFNMRTHGVRRPGAAAIDLSYVAAGRLDGFWELNLNPWDVAAGMLLIEEAGGKITDLPGDKYLLDASSVVASNGLLHNQITDLFKEMLSGIYAADLPPVALPD